jgi:cysteine desulfurase family protein (TIGR01976 family)
MMPAMVNDPIASRFDVAWCRRQFPALDRTVGGQPVVYLDGPGGSQVPRRVIDAVADYLARTNANHGGMFATSRQSDALLDAAHQAVADLFGTADPETIVFGANMTSLTFALSRALAQTWQPGDEIVVTRMDHDANVSPWVLAARDAGATVRHVAIRAEDCTLDLDDLAGKISPQTRLVAVAAASNAVGTILPVDRIAAMAHQVGALIFVDAVHYAPHGSLDVGRWGCDFVAASAYKFFGPHVGVLWGRRELLTKLPAYKVRPAPDSTPGRWMTGTQNHEGIAGTMAAVEYLADLGRNLDARAADRRAALEAAYAAIVAYERGLAELLLAGLGEVPQLKVWGISDPARLDQRVPTVAVTHRTIDPRELAARLAEKGFFVWHGNFYALPLSEALGLEPNGMLRIGLMHYNTREEVQRLLGALAEVGGR